MPVAGVARRLSKWRHLRLLYKVTNRLERHRFANRYAALLQQEDVTLARRDGQLWLMTLDEQVTDQLARERNMRLMTDLCDSAEISYFAVPEPNSPQPRIAIPDADWPRLVAAVVDLAATSPVYCAIRARRLRGGSGWWSVPVAEPRAQDALLGQDQIRIFRIWAPHGEASFFGRGHGVVVERWRTDEHGTLSAPARNERTRVIDVAHQAPATITHQGRSMRSLEVLARPHIFDLDFDVDLVYLWVDGGDPEWQARKRRCLEQLGRRPDHQGNQDARFRDYGELRYSLRSVHEFAPWVRRIHLVTDRQVPSWLDTDHPQLHVVDHTELFGEAGRLPTFNSHAIGSRLHHIDGLSDHYLYVNDDVLFGRPVTPSQFFLSNGTVQFFLSRATLPYAGSGAAPAHEAARRNVVELLERDFGRTATRTFFHTPVAQSRSIMLELEERYPEVFRHNWSSQLRSTRDYEVNQWLHHYYGYLTGQAIPGSIRYDYFDLADPAVPRRLKKLLKSRDKDCLCINDNAEALLENQDYVVEWMERYLPRRSPFERAGAPVPGSSNELGNG